MKKTVLSAVMLTLYAVALVVVALPAAVAGMLWHCAQGGWDAGNDVGCAVARRRFWVRVRNRRIWIRDVA